MLTVKLFISLGFFLTVPLVVMGQYIEIPCDGPECTFNDLILLVSEVLDFIIILAVLLSAVMFAWAGFIYITAGGDKTKVNQAHGIFKNVGLGLVVVLAAWLIVDLILVALTDRGVEDWDPEANTSYLILPKR